MTARDAQDAKTRRAAARSTWPIRRFALGAESEPDLSETNALRDCKTPRFDPLPHPWRSVPRL